ncbi:MAG TPA: pyridoxamine 5'-phosphate oxidase family protein [Candidatus Deferrimicrobium sp.]|nr:pyridoxamine 5'-phosphate oxidase family protein [Candidatus Deferrimicrobium sp.]
MTPSPTLTHGRHPERGTTDMTAIHAILDAERICHVAFVVDGWPYAVPTIHARDGDRLLIHGSTLSRMLGRLAAGVPVCVTVTGVDGIVCARSAFNHSMNYRSAMVFGTAAPIREQHEKLTALRTIVEHVLPGRWEEVRPPTVTELRATEVVAVPLDWATAKIRNDGSVDTPADLKRKVWSGVLPIQTTYGQPVLVAADVADLPMPPSVLSALDAASR